MWRLDRPRFAFGLNPPSTSSTPDPFFLHSVLLAFRSILQIFFGCLASEMKVGSLPAFPFAVSPPLFLEFYFLKIFSTCIRVSTSRSLLGLGVGSETHEFILEFLCLSEQRRDDGDEVDTKDTTME